MTAFLFETALGNVLSGLLVKNYLDSPFKVCRKNKHGLIIVVQCSLGNSTASVELKQSLQLRFQLNVILIGIRLLLLSGVLRPIGVLRHLVGLRPTSVGLPRAERVGLSLRRLGLLSVPVGYLSPGSGGGPSASGLFASFVVFQHPSTEHSYSSLDSDASYPDA